MYCVERLASLINPINPTVASDWLASGLELKKKNKTKQKKSYCKQTKWLYFICLCVMYVYICVLLCLQGVALPIISPITMQLQHFFLSIQNKKRGNVGQGNSTVHSALYHFMSLCLSVYRAKCHPVLTHLTVSHNRYLHINKYTWLSFYIKLSFNL